MIPYGEPRPPLLTAKLAEDEVQELLGYALTDGHLAVAKRVIHGPDDRGRPNDALHASMPVATTSQ